MIVGAFSVGAEGRTGGTLAACRQLVASPLADIFDLILVDTAAQTEAERGFRLRFVRALRRIVHAASLSMTGKVDAALLFSANGFSWVERCVLAVIFRIAHVRVLLFPRTGLVTEELARSGPLRAFSAIAVWACSGVLCQGESFRQAFLRSIPSAREKLHVIPNWIDATPEIADARPEGKGVTIVFIGWLERYKAVDVLIEAALRRKDDLQDCRFIICGDGPERGALEQQALALPGQFEFRGWIDPAQKRDLLAASDILVLPSRIEGMPNVLLEAMAAARAVISTTVGCIPDLVDNGMQGYLVPPDDVDALGQALTTLVKNSDLRQAMGLAGRQKILTSHLIDNAWKRIARLLSPNIQLPKGSEA
jgi:glycosyltransferase involved in cell wall biosynthesis